ncbi:MAG TPA: MASE1 domain-containing protein [Solimonas sp.]|nr:MASE1 domain-containing protein [Solimonas sp.]
MNPAPVATHAPIQPGGWHRARVLLAIGAVYFLAGKLGLSFALINHSATAVWPPTGIALGALLVFGRGVWPAIFIGAFLVNLTTAGSALTSLGIAMGNTLEGLLGAWLVQRHAGGVACFYIARNVFKFAALAGLLATAVSATVGVATLLAGGFADPATAGAVWLTWWLGDASGALVVTPLILLWHEDRASREAGDRTTESLLMLLATIAVAAAVFGWSRLPLTFLCMAPLAWAAFRLGSREVATTVGLMSTIAAWATLHGSGPFAMVAGNDALLILQAFMATTAMTILPIAALVGEHRQAAQQAAAAAIEAQTANHAKDEFLAMLSHELRNPLHAINNSAALLQRGAPPAEYGAALEILRRQTDHLSRLVVDLLDVTRAVGGDLALARCPVNLQLVIGKAVDELATGQDRVTAEAEEVWVDADPVRLQQVLMNLLDNALRFTPGGGSIRVHALHEGGKAVIRVEDSGIGIEPALLQRIFDPFTQGRRGLDRQGGGLGIGLTLARKLVSQHGGSLEAHSPGLGQGTSVVLRLPAIEPPAPAAAPPAPQARRVLVIEDNDDARNSLCALLTAVGYEVHEAVDGKAGVDEALRLQPDVVLVDIGLPVLDGYEVARQIKAGGGRGKLVALTGYGRSEDRQLSDEAGFDEHLVKPVTLEQLRKSIEE